MTMLYNPKSASRLPLKTALKSAPRAALKSLVLACILVGLSANLTGCDKIKGMMGGADNTQADAQASAPTSGNAANNLTKPAVKAEDGLYPFAKWQALDVPAVAITDTAQLLSAMQAGSQKREAWLDFAGNEATLYSLSDKTEYINLVDSTNYLELNWFRPDPDDTPESQVVSKDNTKKAYLLARSVLGEGGEALIKAMLAGKGEAEQDIASVEGVVDGQINGKQVMMARCDYFDCMLVIKK